MMRKILPSRKSMLVLCASMSTLVHAFFVVPPVSHHHAPRRQSQQQYTLHGPIPLSANYPLYDIMGQPQRRRGGRILITQMVNDGWNDDEDPRFMSPKHIDTGFLKRGKAAPLWEDTSLMTAEALNEIFAPDEKENIFLIRSMWTASCIFRLDGILIDSLDIHCRIWERVATKIDAPMPNSNQVSRSLHMSPEEAIVKIFDWTTDQQEAHQLGQAFDEIAMEEFEREKDLAPLPGAIEVVENMLESEIPSAVISNLPLEIIELSLEKIGMKEMIECIETYDNRLKTESQLLLNACLELERPPRHAVFFDFSAEGIDCAHENDMRRPPRHAVFFDFSAEGIDCAHENDMRVGSAEGIACAHENDMRAVALDGLYYQELEINQCDAKVTKLTDWTLPRFRQLIERYPFDEQYQTITALSAYRAPVKRQTAVATFDDFRYEKGTDGKLRPTEEYLRTEEKRREQRDRRLRKGARGSLPEGSKFFSRKKTKAGEDEEEE